MFGVYEFGGFQQGDQRIVLVKLERRLQRRVPMPPEYSMRWRLAREKAAK